MRARRTAATQRRVTALPFKHLVLAVAHDHLVDRLCHLVIFHTTGLILKQDDAILQFSFQLDVYRCSLSSSSSTKV